MGNNVSATSIKRRSGCKTGVTIKYGCNGCNLTHGSKFEQTH